MTRHDVTPAGHTRRRLRVDAGPLTLVALVVAVLAAVLTGGSSAVRSLADQEVRQAAAGLPSTERSLSQQLLQPLPFAPPGADAGTSGWGPLLAALDRVRDGLPPELRAVTTAPRLLARSPRTPLTPTQQGALLQNLQFDAYPGLPDRARLAAGRFPDEGRAPAGAAVEVVMAAPAATRLGWQLGATRTLQGSGLRVTLVGLLDPASLGADLLAVEPLAPDAQLFDDGNNPAAYTAVGFVAAPGWAGVLADPDAGTGTAGRVWIDVDPGAVAAAAVPQLVADLRKVSATDLPLLGLPTGDLEQLRLRSALPGAIVAAAARADAAAVIQLVALSGPLVAAAAVLVLALAALRRRRRPVSALLLDRGAEPRAVALQGMWTGLAAGVPGWLLGSLLVALLAPWQVAGWAVLLGAPGAVLPPLVLAGEVRAGGTGAGVGRRERSDLGRRTPRWRWAVDAAVVLLAAVGMAVLLTGGPGTTTGVDPLLVAAPVLAVLAVCVITLRLYPFPLALLRRATRRGRGLLGHLGVTRSLREPVVGLPLILACLTGVAVATLSGTVLATVDGGVRDAAARAAGSDLTLTGINVLPGVVDAARAVPGVTAAAGLGLVSSVDVGTGSGPTTGAVLWQSDLTALSAATAGVPGAPRVSALPAGGPVPVVVSAALAAQLPDRFQVEGVEVQVIAAAAVLPRVSDPDWILVDRSRVAELRSAPPDDDVLLTALAPGADTAAVAAALTAAAQRVPGAAPLNYQGQQAFTVSTDTPAARAAVLDAAPSIEGLHRLLLVVTLVCALLTVVAVLVIAVGGGPERRRLVAVLRVIGLRPRQVAVLVAWEQGPPVLASAAVGAAGGVALAVVLVHAVDLRAFTGDVLAPSLVVDPLRIVLLVGVFAVAAALAVVLSATAAVRAARRGAWREVE